MLSFFLKKKQNPDTPHEEIIQGRSDPTPNNGADDFIFVEKKGNGDQMPQPSSHAMYPAMPSAFSRTPYPMVPYPERSQATTVNTNVPVVPYVHDVPFVLAPQLLIKTTSDRTQTQVDGVLALLTRQMSVDEKEDYNFALERSIRSECY